MNETVRCPFCRAPLTLPSSFDGRTVQCPRCERDFDPFADGASVSKWDSARPEPPRGEWKGTLAMALLAGSVLAFAFQLFVNGMRMSLIAELEDLQNFAFAFPLDFDDRWLYWEQASASMVGYTVFLFLLAVVGFFIWLYQASDNLRSLHADGLTHAPAGAVFSFFVPFLNFFRPCAIVQEICKASDPRALYNKRAWQSSPPWRSVTFWWISFLGGYLLALLCLWIGGEGHHDGLEKQRVVLFFWCASNLAMIVAGGLLIVVIHTLEQQQQQRYEQICAEND